MIFLKKNISISLLVAYTAKDRVIGAQGKIPWFIPSERDRFKSICRGKYVIIGRKSFEEIGKPLSYCTLVVISKSLKSVPEGCLLCKSFKKAVKMIYKLEKAGEKNPSFGEDLISDEKNPSCGEDLISGEKSSKPSAPGKTEILVAGGEEIYRKALPLADRIYATEIKKEFAGDKFFPKLDGRWKKKTEKECSEDGIEYNYVLFTKG